MNQEMGTHVLEVTVLILRCVNICCIILHVLVRLSWSVVSISHKQNVLELFIIR
jgi:hypothetical protein